MINHFMPNERLNKTNILHFENMKKFTSALKMKEKKREKSSIFFLYSNGFCFASKDNAVSNF